jgi:uncharacterized membrane protein YfcA
VDWKLSAAGLLVGVLVGMTGMGGGSLLTPILVILFGFEPTVAVGTDILHGAIFKSFGAVRHRTFGQVNVRLGLWMLLGSAPMSLLGVALATHIEHVYGDGAESVEGKILGAALVLGGLGFLAKALLRDRTATSQMERLTGRDRAIAFAIGFVGGFVVGLTSVGSGTFFGLTMLLVFPLPAALLIGTDIFHAAVLLWVAGSGHLIAGNVDTHAMAWLLVGSIPGVLIGSQLTLRMADRALRFALAATLTLSGIKLLEVPGSSWIVVGVLAGAALVASGVVLWRLRPRADRRPVPVRAGD